MSNLSTSKRVNQLISSPIRKYHPLVKAAEKRGVKFFKLNIGDPDIVPSPQIFRALKNYKQKNIGYAPSAGSADNVEAWVKFYKSFGLKLKPDNVLVTTGASEAILFTLHAIADPGDEMIIFEPLYTNYKGFGIMSDLKLVPVTLKVEDNFALPKKEEIIKKISKKTKAILVINPDNPTGKVWTRKELEEILQIARKYKLYVIVDETYRELIFKGRPLSLLSFPKVKDWVIMIDSVSKRFSVPGLRIGAVVTYNQKVMQALNKLAMVRLSAPSLGQYAITPLLKNSKVYTKKITAEYKKRRDIVNQALNKIPDIVTYQPQGAFYQVIKLPLKNAEKFIEFMITKFRYKNQTVLISPMQDFYITPNLGKNEIRIAYVLSPDKLKQAMQVLKKGLKEYLEF